MFWKRKKNNKKKGDTLRDLPGVPESLWQTVRFAGWRNGSARFPGRHGALYREFASNVTEHRAYTPGDDLRFLDQRVLARTEKEFVRLSAIESNLKCAFLIDCSASMDFPGTTGKFFSACALTWTGANLFNRSGDHTSLVPIGCRDRTVIPWGRGREHLNRMRRYLQTVTPSGIQDIASTVKNAYGLLKTNTTAVVFSDFLSREKHLMQKLSELSDTGCDVVLIQILSNEEKNPAFSGGTTQEHPNHLRGNVKIIDPETGKSIKVNGPEIGKAYKRIVAERQNMLEKFAGERGSLFLPFEPGADRPAELWKTVFFKRSGKQP